MGTNAIARSAMARIRRAMILSASAKAFLFFRVKAFGFFLNVLSLLSSPELRLFVS